jgi:hypothetical protein
MHSKTTVQKLFSRLLIHFNVVLCCPILNLGDHQLVARTSHPWMVDGCIHASSCRIATPRLEPLGYPVLPIWLQPSSIKRLSAT